VAILSILLLTRTTYSSILRNVQVHLDFQRRIAGTDQNVLVHQYGSFSAETQSSCVVSRINDNASGYNP
jgi:hypothetical protein